MTLDTGWSNSGAVGTAFGIYEEAGRDLGDTRFRIQQHRTNQDSST